MSDEPKDHSHSDVDRTDTGEFVLDQRLSTDDEWEFVLQRPADRLDDRGLTTTIVMAVADAEGIAPKDVKDPPLFEAIDAVALEQAFFGRGDRESAHDENMTTEFMYHDHRIVVRSDGWVLVYDRRED